MTGVMLASDCMVKIINNTGKKRGMLFSLSIMLLGISLLTFAFFLAQQSTTETRAVSSLLEIDRTVDVFSGAQDQIVHIISQSINISVQNSTVTIVESLPLSASMASDLEHFKQFEENYADVNTTMDLANIKTGNFIIWPQGVAINNSAGDLWNNFTVLPQDTLDSAGSLQEYSINITVPAGGEHNIIWQPGNISGENMSVQILVYVADYLVFNNSSIIGKYDNSTLNITKDNVTIAQVDFLLPAALRLQYDNNVTMDLKTSVRFSSPVYIEANDTITVQSSVNKTGRVRIA